MQTKILIIVGVSVASVLALFIMGFFLDKDADKKEKAAAGNKRMPDQPKQQDAA